MANSDKNIVITPNIGSSTADPQIVFTGGSATSSATITVKAYPTNFGTLSVEGAAGQLFSIVNTMTGSIFSVNDITGIPSINVTDAGLVSLTSVGNGFVVIANNSATSTTATGALTVGGGVGIAGGMIVGGITTVTNTTAASSTSTGAFQVRGGVGINGAVYTSGSIYSAGDVVTNFSDMRLKDVIAPIEQAVEKVKAIETFYYRPNQLAKELGQDDKRRVGVSAQSVNAVLSEVVLPSPVNGDYFTVQYERIVPLLIAAIQEQQREIDELKRRLGGQ